MLYADSGELIRGESVIAWAVDTEAPKNGSINATSYPIGPDGSPASNWMGYEFPDKRARLLDAESESFDAARQANAKSVEGSPTR